MFQCAKPVFPAEAKDQMNLFYGFYTRLPRAARGTLRITGVSTYQIFLNGDFLFSGPARSCHGKYRVDEVPLDGLLTAEENVLAVVLAAYQCNSFSFIDEPGFLCAEAECDGTIAARTGENGDFHCLRLDERYQKVIRYSFQRNFSEAYRLDDRWNRFFTVPESSGHEALPLTEQPPKDFIPRDLYLPEFEPEKAAQLLKSGPLTPAQPGQPLRRNRAQQPDERYKAYAQEELDFNVLDEIQALAVGPETGFGGDPADFTVPAMTYQDGALAHEMTGFFDLDVEAAEDTEAYLLFDEIYNGETVNDYRYGCSNSVKLVLAPGRYRLMTIEPYAWKYLRVLCRKGALRVRNLGLRRVGFPDRVKHMTFADGDLQKIYDAAVETFRQNTYDIYMDCPSRERAGWLCDSYFTSRTEHFLTGKSEVEKAFLSNFVDATVFPGVEPGMLPMCYPSDHPDRKFIPNWAMWFVVELEEYLGRTGDRELIDRARDKVEALMAFFRRYENGDGLLEKLPSWVFVEWSRSNDLVQDVNYPSNMLYALVKRAVSRLYGDKTLAAEADALARHIREKTRVGVFYCDNSLRQADGTLTLSGECTESCQYYAFFTGVATPEQDPELWKILTTEFGPQRKQDNAYPEIAFSNAFIGNYLRLELLRRYGLTDRLREEIRGYFLYMAEKTGTLWENDTDVASCNHGFASYTAALLAACAPEA